MVTYKSWLGKVVGAQFRELWKRFWNKYTEQGDGGYIGYATKKLVNFPFEALQDMLINVYNKFYWLTADLIHQMGCNIGDNSMSKIDQTLDTALSQIKTQVQKAKEYIHYELIKPIENKLKEIEPHVNDLIDRVEDAETTIKNAENRINEALTDVANLNKYVKDLSGRFNSLSTKVEDTFRNIDSKINKFNVEIGDFEASINNMKNTITDFQSRIGTMDTLISDFESRLAKAKETLTTHTDNIQELFDRIKELEGKIVEKPTVLEWIKEMLPA